MRRAFVKPRNCHSQLTCVKAGTYYAALRYLAFLPTGEEIAWSEKVVKAFDDNPTSGVVKIDGKMIDKPHLRAAEKILALRVK